MQRIIYFTELDMLTKGAMCFLVNKQKFYLHTVVLTKIYFVHHYPLKNPSSAFYSSLKIYKKLYICENINF